MTIFVIFATISKNRKLLSRGIAALPPGVWQPYPPGDCGYAPGVAAYSPEG